MERRTTSFGLCVIGAGLIAHGSGIETGTFLIGAGLFGLWHSGEKTSKSCVNHMLAYTRNGIEKRFPITG